MISQAKRFNQNILNPPDISGFVGGKTWVAGNLLDKRINVVSKMFGDADVVENDVKETYEAYLTNLASRKSVREKRYNEIEKYNSEKNLFFDSLKEDQLGVETILLNNVSNNFDKEDTQSIEFAFYNVVLNDSKWDGIIVEYGYNYGNFLIIKEGQSSPKLFKDVKWPHKNRNAIQYAKFSFPHGQNQEFLNNLNASERLLIKTESSSWHSD